MMVYISASQAQQQLQQDQFDERMKNIAASLQQDVDGTGWTPTIRMTGSNYKIKSSIQIDTLYNYMVSMNYV